MNEATVYKHQSGARLGHGVDPGLARNRDARRILQPFDKRECLSLKQAAAVAGKSESTLRNWCEVHALGRRVGGGVWSVSKVALAMFLDGDEKALEAYHRGDQASLVVGQYLHRFGLSRGHQS